MSAASNTMTFISQQSLSIHIAASLAHAPSTTTNFKANKSQFWALPWNSWLSYRKEDSVVAILIIIIIIQWLGVCMKRKRKLSRKQSGARPMTELKHAHLTRQARTRRGRLFRTGGMSELGSSATGINKKRQRRISNSLLYVDKLTKTKRAQ